jgi:hypothetical protein
VTSKGGIAGSAAEVRNTHTQSVHAGSKKRRFHVRGHSMCALCVAWLKGRVCELSSSVT